MIALTLSVSYSAKSTEHKTYNLFEKINNRASIPVFFPWLWKYQDYEIRDCEGIMFDCDNKKTSYGLIWTSEGVPLNLAAFESVVSKEQRKRMTSDPNTIFLAHEEWNYYATQWGKFLPANSKFYRDDVFRPHVGTEYKKTMMINFYHPDWPDHLATRAHSYKKAGFNGLFLDWWHDHADDADNGKPPYYVLKSRLKIAKAIRKKVGEDFILLGNAGWNEDDPTSDYLSGVFLELYKHSTNRYLIYYKDEVIKPYQQPQYSIERMEDLLKYWNENLRAPKIICFEPWKVARYQNRSDYTTEDNYKDRRSKENIKLAKLFTAMALVQADYPYILYSDNNLDWDGGDHQHAYYDFYKIDIGRSKALPVEVKRGINYRIFEKGIVVYNRTKSKSSFVTKEGYEIEIDSLTGLIIKD